MPDTIDRSAEIKQQIKELAQGLGVEQELAVQLADKCYDQVYWRPYGGAVSFDEIEQHESAMLYAAKVDQTTYQLRGIVENITSEEELNTDEKAVAIQQAANDYRSRIDSLKIEDSNKSIFDKIKDGLFGEKRQYSADERQQMAKTGQARPDGSYPIKDETDLKNAIRAWGRGGATAADKRHIIKRARTLGKTDVLPENWSAKTLGDVEIYGSSFKVFKDKEGDYRWLSLSSNAFEDLEGELFTTKALKEAIEYADKSGERGPLLVAHIPSAEIGQCDFQALAGRFLVESGTFDDTPLGQKMLDFLVNTDEELQVSIGYGYYDGDEQDRQYDWLRIKERSVLPIEIAAANPWTEFQVIGGKQLDQKHAAVLERIFGKELATGIIAGAEDKTKELEQNGVRFKELGESSNENIKSLYATIQKMPQGDIRTELETQLVQLGGKVMDEDEEDEEDNKKKKTDDKKEADETVGAPAFGQEQFTQLASLITELTSKVEEISQVKELVTTLQNNVKELQLSDEEKIAKALTPKVSPNSESVRPTEDGSNVLNDDKVKELFSDENTEQPTNPALVYVQDLMKNGAVR